MGCFYIFLAMAVVALAFVGEVVLEEIELGNIKKGYLRSLWVVPEEIKDGRIIIDVGHPTFHSRVQIMALESQNSAACENIRSIEIRSAESAPFGPSGKLVSSILDVRNKVPKAIARLRNVQNVSWSLDREPRWLADSVIQTVASLPSLSEFTINYSYRSEQYPSLHHLKNLTKLIVRSRCDNFQEKIVPGIAQAIANSPDLKLLDVDSGQWSDERVTTLHDLFSDVESPLKLQHLGLAGIGVGLDISTLRHLQSLTSLEWMSTAFMKDDNYANSTEEVWHTLGTEGIKLSRLKTNLMSDGLLQYLSSYQGLRDLRLKWVSGKNDNDSDRLANIFFQEVLPRHQNSLEIFHINGGFEGDWCFGQNNIASILNCAKLKELETSVYWPRGHARSDGTPVYFLLNSTSQLPQLHSLRIHTASDPLDRYAMCGNPSIAHDDAVYQAIFSALGKFEAQTGNVTSLPVSELRVRWEVFELREGRYHRTITLDHPYW